MLSNDYDNNCHAEAKKPRSLNLRVSYRLEEGEKLNHALQYVMSKINFMPIGDFAFDRDSGSEIILIDSDGSSLKIVFKILEPGNDMKNIAFHTDDCLRDYHKYILSGVEFINRPEYSPSGLQVNFIDDNDNCYTLLEERSYTDS